MCSLVAFQWLYELALAMLKFITCPLHHFQNCQVEPRRRVKEKLQGIEANCFFETLHCPPKDPTLPKRNERNMGATAKDTSSSAYPLSLCQRLICCPVLKENAAVKYCLVLRDRDRIIALILKIHGTVLLKTYPFRSDDSRRLFTQSLSFPFQ